MNSKVIEHFSKRSSVYNQTQWVNDEKMLQSITFFIEDHLQDSTVILDHGAGTGAVSNYILTHCNANISIKAVDICKPMLNKIENPVIEKIVSTVENLPFSNNSFDIIVSRQCLHYVDDLDIAFSEIRRVLKPNGVFVLCQIVPFESETKDFWIKMMRIRQPLRKVFYSAEEWINHAKTYSLYLDNYVDMQLPYSVNAWAQLYTVDSKIDSSPYISLIKNAPPKYLEEYKVKIIGDKVWLTANAVTMKFINSK